MTKNHPFPSSNKRELTTTMNDVGADPEVFDDAEILALGEIDSLVSGVTSKPKPPEKSQTTVYLDPKVARAFNAFGKKNGKGAKSELVNNFLKKALKVE